MNLMECDVQLSKDKVVVISHDPVLDRVCGTEFEGKRIGDYNFEELPPLKRSIGLHLGDGAYDLSEKETGKFSSLRQLFQEADGFYVSIDMKTATEEMVTKVN